MSSTLTIDEKEIRDLHTLALQDLVVSWLSLIIYLRRRNINNCRLMRIINYRAEYIDPESLDKGEFIELVVEIFYDVLITKYGRLIADILINRLIYRNARVMTDVVEKGVYDGLLSIGVDRGMAKDIVMLFIDDNMLDRIINILKKYC